MAQFDVYRNRDPSSKKRIPCLLDVQADLLGSLATRVVVPMCKLELLDGKAITRLTPVLTVDGARLMMLTPQLAGVSTAVLGPKIASLEADRGAIVAALDLLLLGF